MKKIHMMIAALLAFLPTMLWGHSTDHYGKVSLVSGGGGTVYLTENSDGATSLGTSKGWHCEQSESADSHTYRCYAVPNADYRFVEWSGTDVDATKKTNNPMEYTGKATGSSTNPNEFVLTATFVKIEKYDITYECSGGSYVAGSRTITSELTVQESNETAVMFKSPQPNAGYKFVGWYKKHPNGVKEFVSYCQSYEMLYDSSVAVGAEFVADHTVTFEAPSDGSMTYKIGDAAAVSVEDENEHVAVPHSSIVTLSAESFDSNRTAKWYVRDEAGAKSYFAGTPTATRTVSASETIGVDFIAQNRVLVCAIELAQANGGTATIDGDAEVVYGTTTTIPAGVTIDLGGNTLYVDGTLVNNGTIQNGTISKCTNLIRQTGNGLAPIVADNISYWDTRIENYTATAPGSSTTHLTIINGYGSVIRGVMANASPAAIVCQIDISAGAAVNTITNYVADYSKIGGGNGGAIYAAGRTGDNTGKIVVQLASSVSLSVTSDFPSSTGWQATSKKNGVSTENGKLGQGYRIDCAHNSITLQYEFTNASITYIINASSAQRTSGYLLSATENFINCANVKQRINANDEKYTDKFNVYDCSFSSTVDIYIDGSSVFKESGCGVNFRSGGPYTIPSTGNSNYHAFGGYYTTKPSEGRIGPSNCTFYQHADSYWYLEPTQDPNVATVDGAKKLYLSEAFEVAIAETEARSTITLLKDCTLQDAVTIPKDIKVRVDLAGCKITAPNGFVVNRGDLEIGDKYGNLSKSGVISESENIFVNENGGKITVAYGKYTGGILLNAGSEFITHHGRFESPLTFGEGVSDKSAVAKLKGGIFSADVRECLSEEYQQKGSYVGFFPEAHVEDDEMSGYERAYHLTAFDRDDAQAYEGSVTPYSVDWYRRAELQSAIAPYTSYSIDAVLSFDRSVEARSVTVYAKNSQLGRPLNITTDVAANVDYRVMSPQVASQRYYQISYSRFISDKDVKSISCAINDDKGDNRGTTCTIRMDLCSGANKYDISNLTSNYTIAKKSFVFGAGDNAAMLQTAAGAVPNENFFATLEAAIESDATTGKTIKLCNDCNEVLTVNKSCTIDPNGFEFSGTLTAGEGLSKTEANGVYVFSAPNPTDVYVEQVKVDNVVSQVVSEEWLVANEIDTTNASPADIQAAVQDVLNEKDDNGNAKWENLVIGQKADEKAAVTAANGGTETTANIEVSFEVPTNAETGEKIETGYTVKYAFDKTDSTGTVEGEAQDNPTIDIKGVKENDPTYFTMRAVLEATDNSGVTAEVPVEKTIGVFKVASDAVVTIIPVPWQSLGDSDIKATELVHAASLSDDDELIVYGADGKPQTWIVKNGEWTAPVAEYTIGGDVSEPQQEEQQEAAELTRGQGVILKRKDTNKEIVLIGQPVANETEKVETPIAAASANEPSWNLVASPNMAEVDISAAFTEEKGNTSDEIIVPTAGTPKHYTYKEGKWGYTGEISKKTVRLPNGETTTAVQFGHKTDDQKVPAGTGFWYLNKDSSGGKKIAW